MFLLYIHIQTNSMNQCPLIVFNKHKVNRLEIGICPNMIEAGRIKPWSDKNYKFAERNKLVNRRILSETYQTKILSDQSINIKEYGDFGYFSSIC